ncbi:hypothetical protein [Streptomyces sp. 2RAF24]|uniref:hypothetical protein n=1 Tax=Streptomyces sp. 2RAF24 TaxID=3232997 RepID=UPI003F943DDB
MNSVVPDSDYAYVPDFRPTHVVPRDGLPSWESPDPGLPTAPLDAFLPVRLVDRIGDWGRVLCSNGWSAWVDARLLVSVPDDPPAAGGPLTRTADPRPLIARAEDALGRYRRAAEELAGGRADGETFRRRTRGLRVGMVVDGESLWLYDAEHERWLYCDGTGLSTYAASSGPSVAAPGAGSGGGVSVAAPVPLPVPVPEPSEPSGAGGADAAEGTDGSGGPQSPRTPQTPQSPLTPVAPHAPTQIVPRLDSGPPDPAQRTWVVGRPDGPDGSDEPDGPDGADGPDASDGSDGPGEGR